LFRRPAPHPAPAPPAPAPPAAESATPALLVEQARALLSAEEGQLAAVQAQATTLLAVIGVIASIGAAFLGTVVGRDYGLVVRINGYGISAVLLVVMVAGAIAAAGLLASGLSAIGAMRTQPDPKPEGLLPVVGDQFPAMLEQTAAAAARALLALLRYRLALWQSANERARKGVRLAVVYLGVAIVSGLTLVVLVLAGTTTPPQDAHVTNTTPTSAIAVRAVR
jgi:hypothetical protein